MNERVRMGQDGMLLFQCPACGTDHGIYVANLQGVRRPTWKYDGDAEFPTFQPSVRIQWADAIGQRTCHFHVIKGEIQYCGDSTHNLAGRKMFLPVYGS